MNGGLLLQHGRAPRTPARIRILFVSREISGRVLISASVSEARQRTELKW